MNPDDVLRRDWHLYYNNCWMQHKLTKHIYYIEVGEDGFGETSELYGIRPNTKRMLLTPAMIQCWWPRPRSLNTNKGSVYVARQAVRNMMKSASNRHYYILFKDGPLYGPSMMWALADKPTYIHYETALQDIAQGKRTSAAITRDLIFCKHKTNMVKVLYKGKEAGMLSDGIWVPAWERLPIAKRALRRLEQEGIECS